MTEMLTNGAFTGSITGWTTSPPAAEYEASIYYTAAGSAKLAGVGGDPCQLYQTVHLSGATMRYRFSFAARHDLGTQIVRVSVGGDTVVDLDPDDYDSGAWFTYSVELNLQGGLDCIVDFDHIGEGGTWYIDDVSLDRLGYPENSRRSLLWELQKRRRDWGGFKHAEERYLEIINMALAQAPMGLWRVDLDTSLTTIADTVEYSLAEIDGLDVARQVRRVWLHDGEDPGQYYEIGNWEVREDWSGTTLARSLSLALDQIPDEDLTIQVEYYRAQPGLTDDDDEITVDWEWLMSKCMVLLLFEADPTLDDPNQIERDLKYWDAQRSLRETVARQRRPPRKARGRVW